MAAAANENSAVPASPLRIAIVAGEASGDLLGAGLIAELRSLHPGALFAGVGGERMRAQGCETWWACDELAVMGLGEVVRHLPRLLRLRSALRRRLVAWQPDLFVGVDAPDFNLPLERALKRNRIRTVHYVSPSVWAWRAGRAGRIGRSADRVLCLFPMEPEIYARHGVDAVFVGHPLADRVPLVPDRETARAGEHVNQDACVLALLPGSRASEIQRLAPRFLDAVALLLETRPHLVVLAPMASPRCRQQFESQLRAAAGRHARLDASLRSGNFRVLDQQTPEALAAADAVLLASGTAALEAMLAKRPTVIGYIVSPFTAWIVRGLGLIRSRFTALPNVLAGALLMPELLQEACTARALAAELQVQLDLPDAARVAFEARCTELHLALRCNADARAAQSVSELLVAPS